jgi:hypothetical protein
MQSVASCDSDTYRVIIKIATRSSVFVVTLCVSGPERSPVFARWAQLSFESKVWTRVRMTQLYDYLNCHACLGVCGDFLCLGRTDHRYSPAGRFVLNLSCPYTRRGMIEESECALSSACDVPRIHPQHTCRNTTYLHTLLCRLCHGWYCVFFSLIVDPPFVWPVGHAFSGVQSAVIFPYFIDAYCNMRGWRSFVKYEGRPEGSAWFLESLL